MSTIFTHVCIWIAGLVSGFWFSAIVNHSSSPAKKDQSTREFCLALVVPLVCTLAFMVLMTIIVEVLSQMSLEATAIWIIDSLGLINE